jgi:hypothetical protein
MYSAKHRFRLSRHPAFASTEPPPPPPPFSLLDYGTLAVWLDATDVTGTGTNPSNGSVVNTWVNKVQGGGSASGGGNPVLASTGVNGKPGIYLNNMFYSGNMTNTGSVCTAFIVATLAATGTPEYGRLLSLGTAGVPDYSGSNSLIAFLQNNTALQSISSWRGTYMSTKSIPAFATPFYATCIANNTTITNFVNGLAGNSAASTGSFSISRYGVGTSPEAPATSWRGYVSEVIIYNSALSTVSQQAVESYLATKWGIQ